MIELMRTNDLVRLSFVEALLRDAGVEPLVLDAYASVMDGSVLAIPRRLMVDDDDEALARRVLREAEIDPDAPP